jgi:hypothetical protein
MEPSDNKTIVCSVLFLDIVAYSKTPVPAKIAQKKLFNLILANAIQTTPIDERIILDTPDGAAITFLGEVENALNVALAFRKKLFSNSVKMNPPLQVCMSINLGPVRIAQDSNEHLTIVGDGINVAQCIAGFAKPGQILISRPFFEAASSQSPKYAEMCYPDGVHTDKQMREHEVFTIAQFAENAENETKHEITPDTALKPASRYMTKKWLAHALAIFNHASGQQRVLYAGIFICAISLLVVAWHKVNPRTDSPINIGVVAPKSHTKIKSALNENSPKITTQEHTATAIAKIAVSPWGDVYLDGKMQGVSPPLNVLHITPGTHEIEIHNSTLPPYKVIIKVEANKPIIIRHKFAN